MVDTTIKAPTVAEKFEALKAQLEKKGKWNPETEEKVRTQLNYPVETPKKKRKTQASKQGKSKK